MPPSLEPRGVCILRVTRQRTGLLLTVVARADVDSAGSQVETSTLDVDEAVDTVRRFVGDFAARHPVPHHPGR